MGLTAEDETYDVQRLLSESLVSGLIEVPGLSCQLSAISYQLVFLGLLLKAES
jgi:hypothetical protein